MRTARVQIQCDAQHSKSHKLQLRENNPNKRRKKNNQNTKARSDLFDVCDLNECEKFKASKVFGMAERGKKARLIFKELISKG